MAVLIACLRLVGATMMVCVIGYTSVILGIGQLFPETAQGALVTSADGTIVGSRRIAQAFTQDRYVWPRPSAAGAGGYDATAAAGSNKSPTSDELAARAGALIERYGATVVRPLPPELATASGSGLDPDVTLRAALYQAPRIAAARGLPQGDIEKLMRRLAFSPGGLLTQDDLVNVLEVNLALDGLGR